MSGSEKLDQAHHTWDLTELKIVWIAESACPSSASVRYLKRTTQPVKVNR